jgi:hypothetical protein
MKTVDFDAWLRAAKPGDSVVYHRGSCWSVAWARTADGERTNSQQHLIEVADRAIGLQQSGAVHLMQRKTLKEVSESKHADVRVRVSRGPVAQKMCRRPAGGPQHLRRTSGRSADQR